MFHPTAVISPKAKISSNDKIGPFCIVDENVIIEKDCELISHVHITGKTKIGTNNIGLVAYFDQYQAFCFDLSSDSVIKGDLNFNYK